MDSLGKMSGMPSTAFDTYITYGAYGEAGIGKYSSIKSIA